jgi:large subunit ribosomal protein L4
VVFGPVPRDYSYSLPKKVRRAGLLSALSLKRQEEKIVVVEKLELVEVKTKSFLQILEQLEIADSLIVDSDNRNLELSARSVPGVKVVPPRGLNVYDLLRYDYLLITQEALKQVEGRLGS